jgi:hypothetical protein
VSAVFCVIVPCLCNESWGMSGVILHKHRTAQITSNIPQTSLHKHWTITQITPEIPQTSLHKHGTITQITIEIPQTSLHKHV